jgi:hypothetical protein
MRFTALATAFLLINLEPIVGFLPAVPRKVQIQRNHGFSELYLAKKKKKSDGSTTAAVAKPPPAVEVAVLVEDKAAESTLEEPELVLVRSKNYDHYPSPPPRRAWGDTHTTPQKDSRRLFRQSGRSAN